MSIVTFAACGSDDAVTSSVPDTERPATSAQNGTTADSMGDMDHDGTTADPMEDMDHEGGAEETAFAFGRPADADRTIEIRTSNELAFDPAEVAVATRETVTFSITNDGERLHDFVIGDEAAQQEHARRDGRDAGRDCDGR